MTLTEKKYNMARLSPHPWAHNARFYHIYPLGCCDAPPTLFNSLPESRLDRLHGWIDHLVHLGINALYIGPLFVSSSHGYDTIDYYHVDPRLGDTQTLQRLVQALHAQQIRVVLDGVFNHVGREFWAFRDLCRHGQYSGYTQWFQRLSFKTRGRSGDPFSYQGWRRGHHEMVKLKLSHPAVKEHLFGALAYWIQTFDIDGLRLDAAHCMNLRFLSQLANRGRALKSDFWMMGEITHGEYGRWIHKGKLDSVTNYDLCHTLRSAHNDGNYYHLAHLLNYQFGPDGVYRDLHLYNFIDNHDMTRIATYLKNTAHLYPLHILLYTLPGIPTLYYGSEWGQEGRKGRWSDAALRPSIPHPFHWPKKHPGLIPVINKLSALHRNSLALQYGDWHLLHVSEKIMVYLRECHGEKLVVVVYADAYPTEWGINLPWYRW